MCPQLLRHPEREYFMVSQIYVHPIFLSCRSFVRLQRKQSWCIVMCIDSAFFFLFLSGTGFSYFGLASRAHFRSEKRFENGSRYFSRADVFSSENLAFRCSCGKIMTSQYLNFCACSDKELILTATLTFWFYLKLKVSGFSVM